MTIMFNFIFNSVAYKLKQSCKYISFVSTNFSGSQLDAPSEKGAEVRS